MPVLFPFPFPDLTAAGCGFAAVVGAPPGLLPLVCSGQVFGPDRPVSLRLLDIEQSMGVLRGVVMELEDAAYPLLENVYVRHRPAMPPHAVCRMPHGPAVCRRSCGRVATKAGHTHIHHTEVTALVVLNWLCTPVLPVLPVLCLSCVCPVSVLCPVSCVCPAGDKLL